MKKNRQQESSTNKQALSLTAGKGVTIPSLVPALAATLIISALAGASFARNEIWQTPMWLWEDTAAKSPRKGRVHYNLGKAYEVKRFPREAYLQYLAAASLDPDYALAHESLGVSYVSRNQFEAARQELETALRLNPNLVRARVFLSYIDMQGK